MKMDRSKTKTFTLTAETISILRELAKKQSSSLSQELRRLIIEEGKRRNITSE